MESIPVLQTGVSYYGSGLGLSINAMATQMEVLKGHADNIANFGIPGYRKQTPHVTTFAEYLGPNGVEVTKSNEIGRLRQTNMPLDLALAEQGFFRVQDAKTGHVSQTRDGRFMLQKDGMLTTMTGQHVLNELGQTIQITNPPSDLKKGLKIDDHGILTVLDEQSGKFNPVGRLSVVNEGGQKAAKIDVKQGFIEDSNVMLQDEFVGIIPLRRHFEANRQVFMIQNDNLSKLISELGRS
jgi:flagellar basal body rod protein FlgG